MKTLAWRIGCAIADDDTVGGGQSVLDRLRRALERAAPGVVPMEDLMGGFWFDARGVRHLGGETGVVEALRAQAAEVGCVGLRLAIADSAVMARAAARRARPAQIVPPGEDAAWLGALPIEALGLPDALRATLRTLGVQTVAELRALPKGTLETRFSSAGRRALDLACGVDLRRPVAHRAEALPSVTLVLEQPVHQTSALLFGLRARVDVLAARLFQRGLSATGLVLCLDLDDGGPCEATLELAQGQHHPAPLFELLRDRLERMVVDAPVVELSVRVLHAEPVTLRQLSLSTSQVNPAALERALNRLRGRLGAVVVQATAHDAHRPEAAGTWCPVVEVPTASFFPPRQLREGIEPKGVRRVLSEPVQVQVRADTDGERAHLCWAGRTRQGQLYGPTRLSGGWWAKAFAWEDYWFAAEDGAVLWLSRRERWWLRGWLD